jgi:hypothetical protein
MISSGAGPQHDSDHGIMSGHTYCVLRMEEVPMEASAPDANATANGNKPGCIRLVQLQDRKAYQ